MKETYWERSVRINKEAAEMQKNCRKHKCKYFKNFMNGKYSGNVKYCNYICETLKRRDCDPAECQHWRDDE